MKDYKIKDFITAIKHVVMFSSGDAECHRLNTFAIIDDTFNWDTDSIDAKAEKDYYFSRDKHSLLYPSLAISFSRENLSNFRNGKFNNKCITFAVGIIDQYSGGCTNCSPCEKRSKQDIYFDTSDLLTKVLNAIANITLYKTTKGATIEYHYEHPGVMELLLTKGIYDTATIEKKETGIIFEMWERNNLSPDYLETGISKMNTLAKYATITLCEFCSDESLEFKFKEYKDQPCC